MSSDRHGGHRLFRVLVVDDNKDAADTLTLLLRIQGYEVLVAYDGLTALEMALEWKPNAVILDIGLPGMDGIEVAQILRAQPMPHKVLLVAVTGYREQLERLAKGVVTFDAVIAKPGDPEALIDLLKDHVRG
jgi:CheY-like chemotaxis protein